MVSSATRRMGRLVIVFVLLFVGLVVVAAIESGLADRRPPVAGPILRLVGLATWACSAPSRRRHCSHQTTSGRSGLPVLDEADLSSGNKWPSLRGGT